MVIDPTLDEAMKVTVIATGFDRPGEDRPGEDRPRAPMPQININRPTPAPNLASLPINDRERQDRAERDREEEKPTADVPFYRKVIAMSGETTRTASDRTGRTWTTTTFRRC